jgi:hypothetical protein
MDSHWQIQKVAPATAKTARTIVAEPITIRPIRQALPDGITEFVAIHKETELKIAGKTIKCGGNEIPAQQVEMIAGAYGN